MRLIVWASHLALPLLGLWLLVAQPALDLTWEHHPAHFWLVATVAATNVGVGGRMSAAARRRCDGRLYLVSLAFLSAAAFLFLHALATPGVLLGSKNSGFEVAAPVGLFLAAVFAAASSTRFVDRHSTEVMRHWVSLRAGLLVLVVAWATASLLELPPLATAPDAEELRGLLVALALGAVALYGYAVARYYRVYRQRPSVMLISVLTAFVLLAEAMLAMAVARNWHLSWWQWHVLMLAGFGFVAYSAYVQYQREGTAGGLFDTIGAEQTVRQVREEYGSALETLVSAMRRQEEVGWTGDEMTLITAGLASRFGLSEGQAGVLDRAAQALASERDQIRRLDALVAVGHETKVILSESELLQRAVARIAEGVGRDTLRVGLLRDSGLVFPAELSTGLAGEWDRNADDRAVAEALETQEPADAGDGVLVLALTVKGRSAGVLQARRHRGSFAERDRALLQSLANQLSIALENARLYRQIDVLFHQYMSPDVATQLLADPSQAALGGAVVDVTALFADLRGFTAFSELSSPEQIVTMLNRYFAVTAPCVLDDGGTVVQFVGDAMLALFNAPARQHDHALRAARCALAIQRSIDEIAGSSPDWPRFRIGINTGPALVGNIGSEKLRSFNAMGDAVNVAARLESIARPGQVVLGATTYAAIRAVADVHPLGDLAVKGRRERVTAYALTGLQGQRA